MVAFDYDDQRTPEQARMDRTKYVGFQEINCHMIFDVEMDLTRRSRFVAGGHLTKSLASITYSSVLNRDSVSSERLGYNCLRRRQHLLECTLQGKDIVCCRA